VFDRAGSEFDLPKDISVDFTTHDVFVPDSLMTVLSALISSCVASIFLDQFVSFHLFVTCPDSLIY
jgi:hypothetical protein